MTRHIPTQRTLQFDPSATLCGNFHLAHARSRDVQARLNHQRPASRQERETHVGYVLIGALVTTILFLMIYVWPATARLWGPFMIAFSKAFFLVTSYWVSAYRGFNATNPPQGLASELEAAFRWGATAYLLLACVLQWVRYRATSSGSTGYKHLRNVLVAAPLPPAVIFLCLR